MLFTQPEPFLSANALEISGLSDRVAGNYKCFLKVDDATTPASVRNWGKEKAVPSWRIYVIPPDKPDYPGAYRIPQVCFYAPMYDASRQGSPVQVHASVTADAEVVVTGQLNACMFAICGSGDQLHVAHIRPKGLGPEGDNEKAAQGRQKAIKAFLKSEMPDKPTLQESSQENPVTLIGIKKDGKFKFYSQTKFVRRTEKACRRITGVTKL